LVCLNISKLSEFVRELHLINKAQLIAHFSDETSDLKSFAQRVYGSMKNRTYSSKNFSKKLFLFHIVTSNILVVIASVIIYYTSFDESKISKEGYIFFLICYLLIFISMELTERNKKHVWVLFVLLSSIFYISSLWALFNAEIYASILRKAGYGGGVRIELHQVSNNFKTEKEVCYLLIKTKEVLICMDEYNNSIYEFPISDIDKVSYRTIERTLKTYKLPEYNPH